MSTAIEASTTCAACGISITQSPKNHGERHDFCSEECRKAGRTFCLACGKPLIQHERGPRANFCEPLCAVRYRRVGIVNSSIIEEWNRSDCMTCGKPITQPVTGRKRKFCDNTCLLRFHRTGGNEQFLNEEWGAYGPEVRKVLREVQLIVGIGAAKRLATAIDREYIRRRTR